MLTQPDSTAATSAVLVGLYSGIAGRPAPAVIAGFAAVNTGITAGTFFGADSVASALHRPLTYVVSPGLREFVVSPALELSRKDDGSPRKVEELRTDKLLDSAISGAITGGLIRGWRCTSYVVC